MQCVMTFRFETAAEDYRKLLDLECVTSTLHKSPAHLVADENTLSSPLKQVGKAETDQHILGFMADQVNGTICFYPPLSLLFTLWTKFLFICMLDLRLSTEHVGVAFTFWICMQERYISLSLSCVRGSTSLCCFLKSAVVKSGVISSSIPWYFFCCHVWLFHPWVFSQVCTGETWGDVFKYNVTLFLCCAWLFLRLVQH